MYGVHSTAGLVSLILWDIAAAFDVAGWINGRPELPDRVHLLIIAGALTTALISALRGRDDRQRDEWVHVGYRLRVAEEHKHQERSNIRRIR